MERPEPLDVSRIESWHAHVYFDAATRDAAWADRSGYTKRKAAAREDARKARRIQRQRDQLGLGPKKPR